MNELAYKDFRRDDIEYQYNPRESVPEYPELAKKRTVASQRARATLKSFPNIFHGSSPREVLDIYPAEKPRGPVLVYIHGVWAKRQQR